MAVYVNKTCKACGHSWYPKARNENTCPCCGGNDLVHYVEPGKGGGSSFHAQKSKLPTPLLILGALVCGGIVFVWYTENFNKQANPFREWFDGTPTPAPIDAGERTETPTPRPKVDDGVRPTGSPAGSGSAAATGSGTGSSTPPALPPLGKDKLHLVDGRVLEGKIVASSPDAVMFKWRDDAGATQTKSFPRSQVQRVEPAAE